ncbi:MAG TPA: hydrogenase maturation protease [Geobacteraceae bacterium]|nr:hydrogenase maturation protease [Geobacteraceae bacterium]
MKKRLAVVGVGNTLAGDDGAGVVAARRLQTLWADEPEVFFHVLEGDHFEVADLLDRANRFVFIDAVAGEWPGTLARMEESRRAFAPSFHQTDITAVMQTLEKLGTVDPFPAWEVWGVTILPPAELGEGLSPEVEEGVNRLCRRLDRLIGETVGRSNNNHDLNP